MSRPARLGRRGPKPGFDESEVLDRLVSLFWERGYETTSHRDMRERTGLSGSSLYNTFGDKRSIFDRALARYHDLSVVLVEPLIHGRAGLADLQRWVDVLEERVEDGSTPPGCLMIATLGSAIGRDPVVQRRTRANLDRVAAGLSGALERAAGAGEIEADTVAPRAAMLTSAYVGILAAARGEPTGVIALEMVRGLRHTIGAWETAEVGSRAAARAMLIAGAYGTGKSSVAAEIADVLEHEGRPYALLDLDFLGWANPVGFDTHDDRRLLLANLEAVVRNHLAVGIELFVLAGYVGSEDEVRRIGDVLAMPLQVVRLEVPWPEIERRLRAGVGSGRLDDLAEAERQLASPELAEIGDVTIRNDRPIREVAEEILARIGWR